MNTDKKMLVLYQLIKNSKKSDRELAKVLNSSQPTVTRMRKKLELMGLINEYTIIPNFVKLGFEILALTFMDVLRTNEKNQPDKELAEKAHDWVINNPRIIFGAGGEGLGGKNCMMITMHKNFTDFTQFISEFRTKWSKNIKEMDTFIVPLGGKFVKQFSFRHMDEIK